MFDPQRRHLLGQPATSLLSVTQEEDNRNAGEMYNPIPYYRDVDPLRAASSALMAGRRLHDDLPRSGPTNYLSVQQRYVVRKSLATTGKPVWRPAGIAQSGPRPAPQPRIPLQFRPSLSVEQKLRGILKKPTLEVAWKENQSAVFSKVGRIHAISAENKFSHY
ncbi:MAG: hypothetical protein M1834_007221 [Cirrosporium novae-zelandiae]|nr:MAG: hypothetical protein M1834_007221 [Cirrosporium novae-zelandiae]